MVMALVLGVVGLVVLASGFTRRRPATAPVRASPGWYPDPADPRRWRYWNGLAWTEVGPESGGPPSAREPGAAGGG
jgi:hypothetical protein